MHVEVISTDELGDRSYVVTAGADAVVIDPQRDVERFEAAVDDLGATLRLVLETHMHNDYLTGGLELARRRGAEYGVNAADLVAFERRPLTDGDELAVGSLRVAVIATPGHTDTHLAYAVRDLDEPEQPVAVFTGGSLLYGSVGRTDLVDPARTVELTHAQYHSAHRLADTLPAAAQVFPTHGFGSFCSSGSAAGGDDSTIGVERARNDALTEPDEEAFVERLIANLTAYPAYYAHMAPLNRRGPAARTAEPVERVDPAELAKRLEAGEWVVDLRDRVAYAADHAAGTVSVALGNQLATYVGWLAPWGAQLTLIAQSADEIEAARRQLSLIGIDDLSAATGSLDELTSGGVERRGYPRAGFDEVAARPDGEVVLDVRRTDEYVRSHVSGSVHVPLHELLERLGELPNARLWVHCQSGWRSSIAASLLERAGHDVVYVDDDFDHAIGLGLTTA